MTTRLPPLPIDRVVGRVIDALRVSGAVVVSAPPGAGKTTRIPPAMLDAGLAANGRIVIVQPRRLAARVCAQRIADERGRALGDEVGYQVRFERRCSRATRLLIVTEGVLLRFLHDDPCLEDCSAVVFDEFHLRRLDTDVAMAMVRRLRDTVRPDLKVVTMSATLDARKAASFWNDCPLVECDVRVHPVVVEYGDAVLPRDPARRAAWGVEHLLARVRGDLLVFLPGVGEIRSTMRLLTEGRAGAEAEIFPLYADLDPAAQQAAVSRGPRRKIVLATNVAETSITIDGIEGVVDTGLARTPVFDPSVGLERLELQWISRAAADQRAGRAGRTRPGVCLRLWPARADEHRPSHDTPEIARMELSGTVLQLLAWGEKPEELPWFESPPAAALDQARSLLAALGLIDENSRPTELGRAAARLPVQPRLARMLHEAWRLGHPAAGAVTAALLCEHDPFDSPAAGERSLRPPSDSTSDVYDRVVALRQHESGGPTLPWLGRLRSGPARFVLRAAAQLQREVSDAWGKSPPACCDEEEAVLRSLLAGFPDRLVRRSEPGSRFGRMVGGLGVRLAERSAVGEAMLYLAVNVDRGSSEAVVRWASAVERDWLAENHRRVEVQTEFDPKQQRVVARRREFFDDLLIDQTPTAAEESLSRRLLKEAAGQAPLSDFFAAEGSAAAHYLARVRFLANALPEWDWPPLDDDGIGALVEHVSAGCRSFADLRQADWLTALRWLLSPAQAQCVEREAPARLAVPSGSMIALDYPAGRAPVLAVRIQEVFGWHATPRLAAGRVPVLLHLLGPNGRVEQITNDLESFWRTTYHQVRKDLRRRYPKHAWPEDPLTARAERRPQRPRR